MTNYDQSLNDLMTKCPLPDDIREIGTVQTVWALAIQAAIEAMGDASTRKDEGSIGTTATHDSANSVPTSSTTDTLIGKLQKLADHLYSLDSDSGEAHLISEALMILRMREAKRESYKIPPVDQESIDHIEDKFGMVKQAIELLQEWHDLHCESNRRLDADDTYARTQEFLMNNEIEDGK